MLSNYNCKVCNHHWVPNTLNPKQCPKCGSRRWNPCHRQGAIHCNDTEYTALHWISIQNQLPETEIFKQSGSPDFVLTNGKSYEVKAIKKSNPFSVSFLSSAKKPRPKGIYMTKTQYSGILKTYPECILLVFVQDGTNLPIVNMPLADVVSDEILDTLAGKVYIKVTE